MRLNNVTRLNHHHYYTGNVAVLYPWSRDAMLRPRRVTTSVQAAFIPYGSFFFFFMGYS